MELRIIIDDRIVAALVRVKRALSRRRLAVLVAGVTLGSYVIVGAEPISSWNVFASGSPIVAEDVNANFSSIFEAFNDHVVREDMAFTVEASEGCDGLRAAILRVAEYHILPTAMVTIQLSSGTYACSEPVFVNDVFWPRVRIVGAGNSPESTELTFPTNISGFVVRRAVIGEIGYLTITGDNSVESSAGVYLDSGANANLMELSISGFRDGVALYTSSQAVARSVVAHDNTRSGFTVCGSSALEMYAGTEALDNASYGAYLQNNSRLGAHEFVTFRGGLYGVEAQSESYVHVDGSALSDQESAALYSDSGARIYVTGASIDPAPSLACYVSCGGYIHVTGGSSIAEGINLSNITPGTAAADNSYVRIDE